MSEQQHFGHVEWVQYHDANPHIYRELKQLAKQLLAMGKTRGSIWQLGNVLRWNTEVSVVGDFEYKLPNGALAYYARALMARDEVPYRFFETRPLISEPTWWLQYVGSQEVYARAKPKPDPSDAYWEAIGTS